MPYPVKAQVTNYPKGLGGCGKGGSQKVNVRIRDTRYAPAGKEASRYARKENSPALLKVIERTIVVNPFGSPSSWERKG